MIREIEGLAAEAERETGLLLTHLGRNEKYIDMVRPLTKKKGAVCRSYNVGDEDLLVSKGGMTNEPRNVAIYLTKRLTGSNLHEMGRESGINNYSSVGTVVERTRQKAGTDRALRKRIEKLKMDLMVSQEQTPSLI